MSIIDDLENIVEKKIEIVDPSITGSLENKEEYIAEGIKADLLEESVRLELGKGFYKFVSYPDFAASLLNLVDKNNETSVGKEFILPPNVYYMSVGTAKISLGMFYPECSRELIYRSDKQVRVIPNIIICHELSYRNGNKWGVTRTKYWGSIKPLQELPRLPFLGGSPAAGLSLLPFTNVYDNGDLCFGSNVRVSEIISPDFRQLHWYYEMLFTSPFNDDLGLKGLKRNSKFKSDNVSWYKHLADLALENKKFPYSEVDFH